jgi:hypothetical protein
MFEVGRDYEIRMIEGGDETSFVWTIAAFEPPLIKVTSRHVPERIINTSSHAFISAEILPYRSPEQKAADEEKWDDLLGRPPPDQDEA